MESLIKRYSDGNEDAFLDNWPQSQIWVDFYAFASASMTLSMLVRDGKSYGRLNYILHAILYV